MRTRTLRGIFYLLVVLLLAYAGAAYLLLPDVWYHREHQPGLERKPAVTETAQGIPGDPLNVGLVGDPSEVIRAMNAAGWHPADPVTLKSSLEIIESVAFDRPYVDAPVSPLFYEGRKQDFAFEKPIGDSADRRNHVRFWKVLEHGAEGRPVWLGSATLDRGVGLSHDTGAVTHHIDPDVDDERDRLVADLVAARMVTTLYQVSGVGPTLQGRNGEGDPYFTDGEIKVAVLSPGAAIVEGPPRTESDPPLIRTKNGAWAVVRSLMPGAAD